MKTRDLTLSAILLGIGTALHFIAPGFFLGVTPDFIICFMFLAMIINPDFKKSLVIGLAAGMLAALTSKFPGGQIPNIIDKLMTALVVHGMIELIFKNEITTFRMAIIQILGTFVSGTVFLSSVTLLAGFDPNSIPAVMATVVATAAVGNLMLGMVVYKAFTLAQRSLQYN